MKKIVQLQKARLSFPEMNESFEVHCSFGSLWKGYWMLYTDCVHVLAVFLAMCYSSPCCGQGGRVFLQRKQDRQTMVALNRLSSISLIVAFVNIKTSLSL